METTSMWMLLLLASGHLGQGHGACRIDDRTLLGALRPLVMPMPASTPGLGCVDATESLGVVYGCLDLRASDL
jgi:hypothetical protein